MRSQNIPDLLRCIADLCEQGTDQPTRLWFGPYEYIWLDIGNNHWWYEIDTEPLPPFAHDDIVIIGPTSSKENDFLRAIAALKTGDTTLGPNASTYDPSKVKYPTDDIRDHATS